jgi:hypothetical protein
MKRAAALGVLCLCSAAVAADDARVQVEQRIRLSAGLIADSPTAQRIAASGHVQALAHLEESRVHQALAEEALKGGDLVAARREVDHALRHVGQARRLVPDAAARLAAERQRHPALLAHVERLIEAWRARAVADRAEAPGLVDALGRVQAARSLGEQGRFDEANAGLLAAERLVLGGLAPLLNAREIDYTARAATPGEAVQLELARHQSLADLVPLALRELQPRADALALVERYGDTSRTLRAQAQQKLAEGDTTLALEHIRNALLYLQRAFNAAGLAMPSPTGN